MEQPLLSIIIPTRNRHEYLVPTLRTIVKKINAELVVCDNSDSALSEEQLQEFQHLKNFVYRHSSDYLSVVDNFKNAFEISSGEYIVFIGDDDCIGPDIEKIVNWAKSENIEALISYKKRFIANYFWPNVRSKYFGSKYAGKLFLNKFSGRAELINGKQAIASTLKNPGAGLGDMLRAYHGIVSRALTTRVIHKYGFLFGGVSPDIFSGTLLSYESRRSVAIDYPFVIPGASPKSTAGEGAAREDTDSLNERDHIKRFGSNLKWDSRIPEFYSPHTVWAYSQLQAIEKINDPSLEIDFQDLYFRCALRYRAHNKAIIAAANCWRVSGGKLNIAKLATSISNEILGQSQRVWNKFIAPPASHANLDNIGEAYEKIKDTTTSWQPPKII